MFAPLSKKLMIRPNSFTRALFFLLFDALLSFVTLYIAYLLRFNFHIPPIYSLTKLYLLIIGIKIPLLYLFGQYQFTWRYYGLYEAKRLVLAHIAAYSFVSVILLLFYTSFLPFPRSAIVIDFFLSTLFLGAIRIAKRVYLESKWRTDKKPCAIYGINNNTKRLIDLYHSDDLEFEPVAVVEENPNNSYINGIPILSLEKFFKKFHHIQTILIAKKLPPKKLDSLRELFKRHGIKDIKLAYFEGKAFKDIDIEDLLARNPKDLDIKTIRAFIQDKVVLITGAGGSIGSELVKQCREFGAKRVIAVEMSEYNLYTVSERYPDIVPILCDVTQKEDLKKVLQEHKPHIILHAAAYKHVPLSELNPFATIKNNILGTKNTIDLAIEHNVEKFILISTDKAVNPTNIMGATKRVCELYAQNVPSKNTTIAAVRFGNVLGSSGSVIPKFKAQIQKGGPVTITHPKITRYFMLISEACQLVLQSAAIAKSGEIFILDMGEPVKIVDLAKKMMEIYNKEVPIEFIGLRPGEKLYEELLLEGVEEKTEYQSIFIARPTHIDIAFLNEKIAQLLQAKNLKEALALLQELVPEFNHTLHQ